MEQQQPPQVPRVQVPPAQVPPAPPPQAVPGPQTQPFPGPQPPPPPRPIRSRGVLYAIACGAPPAANLHELVTLARRSGWDVWAIPTPAATKFMDVQRLAAATGHPVRSEYRLPHEPEVLPRPDAIVVAPASFTTINKWASGIADTLATSLLCEYTGLDIRIVAAPNVNPPLARHPAFRTSLHRLYDWGVRILFQPSAPPPTWMAPWERILREAEREA